MILKILKSNRPVNYLLTTLFGLILWSASLMKPYVYSFYNGESDNILYKPIHEFLENNLIAESIISLVLVLLLAFLIQLLNTQYAFIRIRTMLPAPLFVLIIGGLTDIHTLHPVYFAAIFLLLAIYRLFSAFDVQRPYSAAFDSGFFLGVGALFYFDIILLFPAFLAGTAILSRESNWRNFTINIIGLLMPFFFALSYGVFTEQVMELLKTFEQNIISVNNHFKMNLYLQFFLAFLILFTVLGSAKLIQQYDTKKVSSRKYFNVLLLIFLFSLAGFILVPPVSQEMLVILAIPICFLVTNFFVFLKSRFWGELLIYLLIGIVFSLQITAF
ncbi:DUF6427 family protein [Maribellus maritimus]|uniref:DUF6427 family protein n=1 Tax=Maribellus maritimus TaxID=2870838 RepID=UPI001EEC0A45|nr:DUF6427 family protein [Maribellus maritimus]MCG6190218.1 DUF6427 family protein [Maribellus maritimus]